MIQLTEKQKEERLQKKIEEYKKGLDELDKKTGMTIVPVLLIDNNMRTQSISLGRNFIQAIVQIVEFQKDEKKL